MEAGRTTELWMKAARPVMIFWLKSANGGKRKRGVLSSQGFEWFAAVSALFWGKTAALSKR